MSFEIWVVDYLMNIDEKFIFVRSFHVAYVFEFDSKGFAFVLETMRVHST